MKFKFGLSFYLKLPLLLAFGVLYYLKTEGTITWSQMKSGTIVIAVLMGIIWLIDPLRSLIKNYKKKEEPEIEKEEVTPPVRENRIKFKKPEKK